MSYINRLLKNFSSSALGNILGLAIGFFTILYLPRVLGPENYGIFNFAQSYIMYFMLFCDLGLSLYCIRTVNQSSNKELIINKIYNVKFYISFISTIIFFISVVIMRKSPIEKCTLYGIGLSILFTGMSIDYIFNALNNMKYVGISVAIKNITFFICCIIFIKNPNNVWLVALLYTISILSMLIFLQYSFRRNYFRLRLSRPSYDNFKILKASLPLAVSLFMVQINNNFDIVYLSFTKTQREVGYYSAAYKIINFLIAILSIYFNAAYPSIAELFKKGKVQLSEFIHKFYTMGITIVTPIVFGGIALSGQIIVFLFGKEYLQSKILFLLLIPLIFIRMVTSTYGAVLIMGDGSKYFSNGVIIGATINIILNILLVPSYGAKGSAIATLLCEILQGIYLYHYFKKYCTSRLLKSNIIPVISSIIMYIIIYNKFNLFLSIIIGIVVYFIFVFIFYFIFANEFISKFLNLLKTRK